MNLDKLKIINLERKIPILRDKTLKLIIDIINKNNYKSVLELGSAIGYSAINIADKTNAEIISLEKNPILHKDAVNNLKYFSNLKITFLNEDATIFKTTDKFDLIFIDASKSKYETFFNNFKNNLNKGGVFFFDNFNFALKDINSYNKRLKPISKKMHNFFANLKNNDNYILKVYKIDDGVLVLKIK